MIDTVNYIVPVPGKTYTLRGGGEYRCLRIVNEDAKHPRDCSARMIRDKDGWTLTVHGLQQNPDGTVEWDYSTQGRWSR